MRKPILDIKDLHIDLSGKAILQGVSLQIQPGKIYALMGPNGAGKSTLATWLAGKPGYTFKKGEVIFQQQNLTDLNVEQRASEGLFMSFQQPISLPGVSMMSFLKTALNQIRTAKNLTPLTALEVAQLLQAKIKLLNMPADILQKSVNENFSGGEKKLNELLQMAVLDPTLAVLDEIDSGLDLDTISLLGKTLQKLRRPDNAFIIITHYPKLFTHITPDIVHILDQGRIIASGDTTLIDDLLKKGYKSFV